MKRCYFAARVAASRTSLGGGSSDDFWVQQSALGVKVLTAVVAMGVEVPIVTVAAAAAAAEAVATVVFMVVVVTAVAVVVLVFAGMQHNLGSFASNCLQQSVSTVSNQGCTLTHVQRLPA